MFRRRRRFLSHANVFDMNDVDFQQHYRLSKDVVRWLCDELRGEPGLRRWSREWTVVPVVNPTNEFYEVNPRNKRVFTTFCNQERNLSLPTGFYNYSDGLLRCVDARKTHLIKFKLKQRIEEKQCT